MECVWDSALLQRANELPAELLFAIQNGSHREYLDAITRASLDLRYTQLLLARSENIFAHVCAGLRSHGNLAATVATLGRVVPFAPFLSPYAENALENERYDFTGSSHFEILEYLLGLFRLLQHDRPTFSAFVHTAEISRLLDSESRPVVYLAIRILQLYLSGADCWFEQMVQRYLGQDTPEGDINGHWEDKTIDYRFLTLWENQRREDVANLLTRERQPQEFDPALSLRVIPEAGFHSSAAFVGGVLLPRTINVGAEGQDGILIYVDTVRQNLRSIAGALKSSQPLLVTGLAGSGKTMLIRHAAQKLGKLDKMVTLHLNEQSDAKLLIGIYTTGDTPGSFLWRPGVLTTAVQEGRCVLIEDLDRAPQSIIGTLLPLIERGELSIPNRKQVIRAKRGFRIIATVRTAQNHRGDEIVPLAHMLGRRHWRDIHINMSSTSEHKEISSHLYPSLRSLLPQFMSVYEGLHALRQPAALAGQSKTGIMRAVSPRDLLKWCSRVSKLLVNRADFTSNDIDDIFLEAVDCFVGALPDSPARDSMVAVVAQGLHIDPQRRDHLLKERSALYEVQKLTIVVGRYSLPRASGPKKSTSASQSSFSTNPHTSRMLERVAAAVTNSEPLLLVGETGVGKTTSVQHLANHLGHKLVPFNLSQQSESGDLLGGFKPVNARTLIIPMQDEFDTLFTSSFSQTKNQQFRELLSKQMARSNWKAVCKLWHQALKMVDQQRASLKPDRQGEAPSKKRKVNTKLSPDFVRWDAFAEKLHDLERRLAVGTDGFAFSFVEGNIVKALRNGDWILLDEVNLASSDTLEALADLLDPMPSLLLTEAGNIERIEAHPNFRLFAAMNPATDVGKKDLPPGIRSRFTELYVDSPDKDLKSLQSIVRAYLRVESSADQAVSFDVAVLYQKIISLSEQNKLVDGAGQKPHFSLRTLTRTLSYAKHITSLCSLRRALYEGFQMSFLTFLDAESAAAVQPLLEQHLFGKKINVRSELRKALCMPEDGHEHVQGYPSSKHWIKRGPLALDEQTHYIITPFIRGNLENLVRATSTRQFPVLIQGPTSSGKTSMIEYLAKRTGHKFVRINNHEHTDLQEYLGTYVSGADGRLQFQEGILVKALRNGHWIVLDELNLAPTDVLEALNRLLDDNRELLIPETQEVVRPHTDFMLFATQNPAGLYGGRKTLSRAFRNRFLELHFDDIPVDELQEILHKRTQLPESRCKRIVSVYRELSVLRQENRLFEQKSFATLRDLFRWALRPNDTIEALATNGFMLLAERVRKPEEREAVKQVLEKVISANGPRVRIDEAALYSPQSKEIEEYTQNSKQTGVVWTKAMRRLYLLVARAIQCNEPVLLVGETGCGKTTVCQMLAHALQQELHIVNAHQNTETGDLIGSQRPVRNRAVVESELRTQLLASPLLQSLDTAAAHPTEALLTAYDQALGASSAEQMHAYTSSTMHLSIQANRLRFKALFEWVDGSLVQALKSGAFFLLDEISLADDSVLERLNSVLEPSRSILLAEKGSLDSFVEAAPGFQFFATMNPGGDYGKRELSPALRNRFTEIWVPALTDMDDVVDIVQAKLNASAQQFAVPIVSFARWFNGQYNTSASSSVSIRDALAWAAFINGFSASDTTAAVVHGAAMVYIDTLGANPAGLMTLSGRSLEAERRACLTELSNAIGFDASAIYGQAPLVHVSDQAFTIGPFAVSRKQSHPTVQTSFNFEAPTTKVNAMRLVRGMQLTKPVMLEGSPGVGKTTLVTAIAAGVGIPLTRINLSEQTDLMDLFGSDVPVEGAETGTFAWRDAPFLRAMKAGEWVLLDEMNLASQSVLEGLNAVLDHRGEVYVPEIGQTFSRHPEFRLFAAQNPHHQGGGRKGLPASFVNRFTVVYADAFRPEDLMLITQKTFAHVDVGLIQQAVSFIGQLEDDVVERRLFGSNGGPWEFNLRDISRWLSLASSEQGLLAAGSSRDFVEMLFRQRFRTPTDRLHLDRVFRATFGSDTHAANLHSSVSSQYVQLGLAVLHRDPLSGPSLTETLPAHMAKEQQLEIMQSLMISVQQAWPVLLSGPSGIGKTALIELLASLVGAPLETFAMNADTDAMDLIGGYEQADPSRQALQVLEDFLAELNTTLKAQLTHSQQSDLLQLVELFSPHNSDFMPDKDRLSVAQAALQSCSLPGKQDVLHQIQQMSSAVDQARFVWIDGVLVDALVQGKWLVLDNANLCSPSVLDRLNSLLEPDGCLIINEHVSDDGALRVIRPHPRFRIFLTVDPRFGELSRAMRNRAVELFMLDSREVSPIQSHLVAESSMCRLSSAKAAATSHMSGKAEADMARVVLENLAIHSEPLISRFSGQLQAGLYNGLSEVSLQLPAAQHIRNLASSQGRTQLTAFYELGANYKQMSADFARVQTLHPLNNQPLAQQNREIFNEALRLAFSQETAFDSNALHTILQQLSSDRDVVRQIANVERSFTSAVSPKSKNKTGWVLDILGDATMAMSRWCDQTTLDSTTLGQARNTVALLLAFFGTFLDTIKLGKLQPASITAFRSVAARICSARDVTADVSALMRAVVSAMSSSTVGAATENECTALWLTLKPTTPANEQDYHMLLAFQNTISRFDEILFQNEQPVEIASNLRLSFVRALSRATSGGLAIQELTQQLDSLADGPMQTRSEETGMLPTKPHFAASFRALSRHFAVLGLTGRSYLQEGLHASLEVLSLRPTNKSALIHAMSATGSTADHRILKSLRSAAWREKDEQSLLPSLSLVHTVAGNTSELDSVSIGQLSPLRSELGVLGQLFGAHADSIGQDEITALDAVLHQLLSAVLGALSRDAKQSSVKEAAQILLAMLHNNDNGSVTLPAESGTPGAAVARFALVIHYLSTSLADAFSKAAAAASAWMNFALACLELYLPQTPFDPALESMLEKQVHEECRTSLQRRLEVVGGFSAAISGEKSTLRTRLLQDQILKLGSGPVVPQVYRPESYALSKIFVEFDALRRLLGSIAQDLKKTSSISDGVWLNLNAIRTRLSENHREYSDFTGPVVGFLDCLDVGYQLACSAAISRSPPSSFIFSLVPFRGASLDTWNSDEAIASMLPLGAEQHVRLLWLDVVVLRNSAKPLSDCSITLRQQVQEQFARFYEHWQRQLSLDQKQEAAKSSLYKYRGAVEDTDEYSADQMDELFPSYEGERDIEAAANIKEKELAPRIAELHRSVYGSSELSRAAVLRLLKETGTAQFHKLMDPALKPAVPAIIASLHYATSSLDESNKDKSAYNLYTDTNPAETRRLRDILQNAIQRFQQLHEIWPEHSTPIEVLRLCGAFMALGHSLPLAQYLPHLEKLHAAVNEWQKIASREHSASSILESTTDLIISWRQLELTSWSSLFDQENSRCQADAASWWFVAYETIVAATDTVDESEVDLGHHTLGLMEVLKNFIENSGFGEYSARLETLRGFVIQLSAENLDTTSRRRVQAALSNFIAYYSHFEQPIRESLSKGRLTLEKEIKDVIQVASWKDRNIDTLRQSAKASHRKLFKIVRKYRALLAQQVGPTIQTGVPDLAIGSGLEADLGDRSRFMVSEPSTAVASPQFKSWQERPDRFRNIDSTVRLMESKTEHIQLASNGVHRLTAFMSDLSSSISELQKATPKTLTDKNKSLIGHLKTRKRRLLADVLKEIRQMGFQHNLSQDVLGQQTTLARVLSRLAASGPLSGTAQYHLHRLLGIMPAVRESARKHSEDLTDAESARCLAHLESILHVSVLQQAHLDLSQRQFPDLSRTMQQLVSIGNGSWTGDGPMGSTAIISWSTAMIDTCVGLVEFQSELGKRDYSDITASLKETAVTCERIKVDMSMEPELPAGIATGQRTTLRDEFEGVMGHLSTRLTTWISVHPELEPTLGQLAGWHHSESQRNASAMANGRPSFSVEDWTANFLQRADAMLASIQSLEKTAHAIGDEDAAWLRGYQHALESIWKHLAVGQLNAGLFAALSDLRRASLESNSIILDLGAVCRSICPLFEAYTTTARQVHSQFNEMHSETCRMGFVLARSFIALARDGFCTPSETTKDDDKQSGNVESGTGLGEGEGAEDISKDVGADEDLSELAQETSDKKKEDGIEDEKDAVDMADEDMEGEVGEAEEASENGSDSGNRDGEEQDLDEETGSVDDLDANAVDEKMWDDGKPPEDQKDKEADAGKGTAQEDEVSAAKEGEEGDDQDKDQESTEQDGAKDDEAASDAGNEEVGQREPETADPHMQEQENLDLPEDMNLDGDKSVDENDSDLGSLPDDDLGPNEDADIDMDIDNVDNADETEPAQDEATPDDEDAEKTQEAGEDVDEGEASEEPENTEDLLQNREDDQQAPTEGAVAGEQGSGQDEEMQEAEREGIAPVSEDEDLNGQSEQPQQADGAQGGQGEKRRQDDPATANNATQEEQQRPYKQLGDLLDNWYKQQREIDAPEQRDEGQEQQEPQDIDMANANFEHLQNHEDTADTQALGTASAEQSKALNEETSLPVNEDEAIEDQPFQEEAQQEEHEVGAPEKETEPAMESNDGPLPDAGAKVFVGDPGRPDADTEMGDLEGPDTDMDEVNDVDTQLTNTHISNEDHPEQMSLDDARRLWAENESITRNLALLLTEHLRLILQPTQATKMRGDFRTGKRLNIKRIIPYIASSYKRDKIWMRRSVPSKRSYQIMLAIDDSKSMAEGEGNLLAFQTLALVAKSMSMLEVGELCVLGFGENVNVAHDFSMPFTSEAGAEVFKSFTFAQTKTNVRKLLADSIDLFREARLKATGTSSELWQLQLIISDGVCEDHPSIRQLVRQAHEERIMIVFIVVDPSAPSTAAAASDAPRQSILDLQTAEFSKDAAGEMQLKMVKYLDTFPFRYYLIVRDVQELPGVLAGALRQWFAEVVDTGS